jgi:hypothetical protein
MSALVGFLIVVAMPLAALVALLKAVDALQRRREDVVMRQIQVTDAIHREFGAIVAPTVRRARGGWRVRLPMDPRRPEAARIVELAACTLGPTATVEVAVVAPFVATPRRQPAQNKERMASAMSV